MKLTISSLATVLNKTPSTASTRLHSKHRLVAGLLLLGAIASSASLMAGKLAGNENSPWSRITTQHFTVYSGGGRQAGLELAEVMEMLHSVLEGLVGADAQSPLPTFVYLFPNDDALQPFKPAMANGRKGSGRAVAGGFFAQRELANYVAINLSTTRGARETVQHEYLHYFAQHNLPRLPLWFNEGLAEYYSTFFVRDGLGYVGAPVPRHLRRLSRDGEYHLTRHELSELVETHSSRELYDDNHRASLLYAQSWALVHHLLSDDLLAQKSLDFMRSLAQGRQPEQAFRASFEAAPGDFSTPLQDYLARANFPTFRATVAAIPTPHIHSMESAQLNAVLGELALATDHPSLAGKLFRDAQERANTLQPETIALEVAGLANVGLSRIALANQDFDHSLFLTRTAAQLIPGSPMPFFLEGKILSNQARIQRIGGATKSRTKLLDSARRAFRASLDRHGKFAAALVALGESWLADPRTSVSPVSFSEEGLSSFAQALDLLPKQQRVASGLALLQTQIGHFPKATRTLRREQTRFVREEHWTAVWEHIAAFEIALLRDQLTRVGKAPIDSDRLLMLVERVNYLRQEASTTEELGNFYNQAMELGRLAEIETLWTALQSAIELASAGQYTTARYEVNDILEELQWNRELEGERVRDLEQEARRLLKAFSE